MPVSPHAERFAIVPETSRAGYHVGEKFFGRQIEVRVAATRPGAVAGELFVDRQRLAASSVGVITVDITAIRSDLPGHDNARDGFLETELYPRVNFVPRRLEGLPEGPLAEGQDLAFKIVGDLTVRTATKEVIFDATGKVVGDTFTGTASAKIQLTAFGLEPPEELQLQVDDNVTLEVTLEARRAR